MIVEAAVRYGAAQLQRTIARRREELDDTARGVSIQRGERSAQNLHPGGGIQVELRDLPLPIRARGRDAVLVHPHAPNPERRVGADATDGNLLILRVVVPVSGQQSGDGGDVVGQIHAEGVVAKLFGGHAADGSGDVERIRFDTGCRDDDLVKRR